MANATDKVITIGLVLKELGCDNVSVYRKTLIKRGTSLNNSINYPIS